MSEFELTVPIIVAGAGACGAVAALAASDAGVSPLVIEQDDRPGGSTGMSQGLFCAAGTASQQALGIDDGPDIFFEDIMAKARGLANPEIARALADHSAPSLEWLRHAHGLPWELDSQFRASYGNSRARLHGWPGRTGLDMVQLLHRRMSDAGIDVLMQTELIDIFTDDDGAVRGVELRRADGAVERIGCGALILACGGFAANREMTSRYMPETTALRYNGHEGSHGAAIFLAEKLGAALGDMGSYQGYAMLSDPQGISVPPVLILEGGILVNRHGARFTDEMKDIAGMVHPMAEQPGGIGWLIYDSEIEQRCLHVPEVAELTALNAAKTADSVPALAQAIGADPENLVSAIAAANVARNNGGHDSVGRLWNAEHPPKRPYRAMRVTGALYHTQGGVEIDARARVLRSDGSAFPNLFAGGGSARSVSGPSSWGYLPAMGLTTAVVLGRLAGMNAAALTAVEAETVAPTAGE